MSMIGKYINRYLSYTSPLWMCAGRYQISEHTRRSRKMLLAASLIGFLIAMIGKLPKSLFGIEFNGGLDHTDHQILLTVGILIVFYFGISFLINFSIDVISSGESYEPPLPGSLFMDKLGHETLQKKLERANSWAYVLDFLLPMIIWVIGLVSLSWFAFHIPA